MPLFALASANPASNVPLSVQWVHDIRNALVVAGLHLETLGRLSGSEGSRAASAAHAAMSRATDMCSASLTDAKALGHSAKRRGFNSMQTIDEIVSILAPVAPDGFEIRVPQEATCMVLADPVDTFRIIFNLMQNAIAAARNGANMSFVGIDVVSNGSAVAIKIYDDGPGLPESIRSNIFRLHNASTTGGSGSGIAIARELAERNGGALRLAANTKGTVFILELAAFCAVGD